MLISGIKSRPQYPGLRPMENAKRHLIAADGDGAKSVLRLFASASADFAAKAEILYVVNSPAAEGHAASLEGLGASRFSEFPSGDALLQELDGILSQATMGARLYAAGTEGFMGRLTRLAIDHGIDHKSVLTEHSGSLARRVQCVHCKGFTENVTVTIFECGHCGNLLLVRDHYSRRLAAFQGVCANAEDPSSRPQAEEAYL